tara:strand:+ start:2374 stop:2814 length:441 start_codon:yes stop_codon:yes gene_type:complete
MNQIILAFIVTAFWDVILRWYAEDRMPHLSAPLDVHAWNWVKVLRPYFEKHTLLGAALIAGFVGAITAYVMSFINLKNNYVYAVILVLLSGFIGLPMRYTGLFPHLKTHYYDTLGFETSFLTDAFSGVVVGVTIFMIHYLQRLKTE